MAPLLLHLARSFPFSPNLNDEDTSSSLLLAEISNQAPCNHGVENAWSIDFGERCVVEGRGEASDSVIYDSVAALYLSLFNGPSIFRLNRDSIHARIRPLHLVFLTFWRAMFRMLVE